MLFSLAGCLVFLFFLQQLVHCETTQNNSIYTTKSEKHFSKEAELIFELLKDYETHVIITLNYLYNAILYLISYSLILCSILSVILKIR